MECSKGERERERYCCATCGDRWSFEHILIDMWRFLRDTESFLASVFNPWRFGASRLLSIFVMVFPSPKEAKTDIPHKYPFAVAI